MTGIWLTAGFHVVVAFAPAAAGDRVVDTDDQGRIRAMYSLDDEGRRHGAYTELFPDGRKKLQARYAAGLLDGPYVEYDARGRKRVEAAYRGGLMHGPRTLRDDRGKVTSEGLMFEGVVAHPRPRHEVEEALRSIVSSGKPKRALDGRREQTRRWIMAYRYLCGLPYEDLTLDGDRNEACQAAAELFEVVGRMSHDPENPGWPADRFRIAAEAAAKSNIHWGAEGFSPEWMVHALVWDSAPDNAERLTHRRWFLAPRYRRLGVGLQGRFGVVWAIDDGGPASQVEWTAFPPPGYVPVEFFGGEPEAGPGVPQLATTWPISWSVFLNGAAFDKPSPDAVTVEVAEVLPDLTCGSPLELDLLSVVTKEVGDAEHAIIFRPRELRPQKGERYRVLVRGLRHGGEAKEIRYLVEFIERRPR